MNPTLAVIGCIFFPVLFASVVGFANERTLQAFVQLLGAVLLLVVVFAHVAEEFHLFYSMRLGSPDSAGHYIDLISAIGGLILLPTGYLWRRLAKRKTSN
jgi:hypothetical protein